MSKQYLEAHTFLKALRDEGVPYTETLVNLMQYAVIEEVAPVVHAHWVKHGEPPWYVIECSECGAKWQTGGSWDANDFCGNCGAKMDEEVEDA